MFDKVLFTPTERETFSNSETFRQFVRTMIMKQRQGEGGKGNFLHTMLEDELFKGDDEKVVDECLTFILAATMTTAMLTSNSIYYLTQNSDTALIKLRTELSQQVQKIPDTVNDWVRVLLKEEVIHTCGYLTQCVQETLRIDPSLRFSTIHEIKGGIELGGFNILED